jgi:hypothetical protein
VDDAATTPGRDDAGFGPDGGVDFAFADEQNWEDHPLAGAFAGATFDGRYIYFVPHGHFTLWRYDTTAPFDAAASWTSVVLPSVDGGQGGFTGAAFYEGYIYLAPATPNTLALRYPADGPFSIAPWEGFDFTDLMAVGAKSADFIGVSHYKNKLYFIPHASRTLVQYDPTKAFKGMESWRSAALPSDAGDFAGSVATIAGLYLVPSGRSLTLFDGVDIADRGSFTSGPELIGDFLGGTTDGKELYFAPADQPNAAIFTIGANLLAGKALQTFPLASLAACSAACFAGAVFDGRHVYFVPRNGARFIRYDTLNARGFGDPSSWAVGRPDAKRADFYGGAFDGRYVYFVPDGSGQVVRFRARDVAAMPGSHQGSFL